MINNNWLTQFNLGLLIPPLSIILLYQPNRAQKAQYPLPQLVVLDNPAVLLSEAAIRLEGPRAVVPAGLQDPELVEFGS